MLELDRTSTPPDPADAGSLLGTPARPGVVLQPIVDLADGSVWSREALCRVPGSPLRYLIAGSGSSLSEKAAIQLEASMLRAALGARERVPSEELLTVNLSPSSLLSEPVQEVLAGLVSLDGVIVELTDHRRPEPVERLLPAVERLREAGAAIALDDVGAGRGALRYARALHPDLIKLDGDVIHHIDMEPMQRIMVESALAVARELDTPVVAEGIETRDELDALLRMGISLGQGFLLARPSPQVDQIPPHIRRWLQARSRESAARAAVSSAQRRVALA